MNRLTLDTGTTNTRVTLWKNEKAVYSTSRPTGVRNTAIEGSNLSLKAAIREAMEEVLLENRLRWSDISRIVASGMITSNMGLLEVPHLYAPAGIEELASGMVKQHIPDIVDQEIWFIPGVKNAIKQISIDNCEQMDMMRGEEAETIGLIVRLAIEGPAMVILPGSHSKFVSIDEHRRITGCLTSLAGELLSAITEHTILANALDKSFAAEFKRDFVLRGYELSSRTGLNRTCFTIRILDQFTALSKDDKANFLLGAVLAGDLQSLKYSDALTISPESHVIIAGKEILRDSFETILKADGYFHRVSVADNETLSDLAGYGALAIARKRGL
jgi:2-dehydro-3-deoxygalactonokinase